jgi:NAD(P)-dependent dehydrogenase (short-subunit alcohol dehydrogenase family)
LGKADELKSVSDEVLELDVASESSINELGKKLEKETVDLLVNNAGIYLRSPFEQMGHKDLIDQFVVNSVAPILVARALLPCLKKSDAPRVVNMTSRMGSIEDNTSGGSYGYRASKAALNAMTKSFSIDFPDIPVIAVHPGYIQTDMTSGRGDMTAKDCAKRLGEMFDVFCNEPQEKCKIKTGSFMHRDQQVLPW